MSTASRSRGVHQAFSLDDLVEEFNQSRLQSGEFTTVQFAERTHIPVETARRHLRKLEQQGDLTSRKIRARCGITMAWKPTH